MFQDPKDKSHSYLKTCTWLVLDEPKLLDDNEKVPKPNRVIGGSESWNRLSTWHDTSLVVKSRM